MICFTNKYAYLPYPYNHLWLLPLVKVSFNAIQSWWTRNCWCYEILQHKTPAMGFKLFSELFTFFTEFISFIHYSFLFILSYEENSSAMGTIKKEDQFGINDLNKDIGFTVVRFSGTTICKFQIFLWHLNKHIPTRIHYKLYFQRLSRNVQNDACFLNTFRPAFFHGLCCRNLAHKNFIFFTKNSLREDKF